jgi:predicted Fe-Mo cluster-binding NifX family protein
VTVETDDKNLTELEYAMKLIFTTLGADWDSPMDSRFGRTQFFFMYDEDSGETQSYDNTDINDEAHGAGTRTAQKLSELGARVLITGNGPGHNAYRVLQAIGTEIYVNASNMTAREAYKAYKSGILPKFGGG